MTKTAKAAFPAVFAVAAFFASLLAGGTWIDPHRLFEALFHPERDRVVAIIVWQLRLPRVVIGALVGACLAVAGALLQGLLRNPLVDPYLTGVSAGAALAIVAGVAAGASAALLPAIGFFAGIATAIAVAALARRGSAMDTTRLILAGVSLSSLFSAIIALLLTRLQTTEAAPAIVGWLAGSLAGRGWSDLFFALPYAALGAIVALFTVPALNVLRLGDLRARSVGVDVPRMQWAILCAASLLTSCSVALSGTIGFLGLIVPHLARRITGSDARFAIASSALLGAALLMLADALCRTLLAPTEIPIGVLLAFVGVPSFLVLYLRSDRMQPV
jgi:iron complex transport system permease protein